MNQPARYTNTAIGLHWLIALIIFATFPLGLVMGDMETSPLKLKLFSYHKWIGVTIFLLAVGRLAWRAGHTPPPLPDTMPPWQRRAANGLHHMLYLLLFAIPLSGWLMSSAEGFQTVYFGVLPLPDLIGKNKLLGDVLSDVHETLNYIMLALVVLHIGAALKHHFIDRDDILARMLPFLNKEKQE
ncbi:cytochrome b [Sulfurimicrobium lacus]|uniref:Cytochrome b n=1 Tax=Sulfurimicrobium lacus TaxID=2715678 RepID=A0A6F8VC09_9PROT|nr:cytochrome b [Sulfurimicrobium lacus]BCB26502.1 cytochrome b [Sulfurimicrobium lacus]